MSLATPNGILARHGAVWLTMVGMAVGGISWALGLAAKVDSQQEQIAALQAEVANRREAMALIEGNQKDIARNEAAIDELKRILELRGTIRETFARITEHLRTLDERVVQLERALGWRGERWPDTGPDVR